jgi:glutathione peroxidase
MINRRTVMIAALTAIAGATSSRVANAQAGMSRITAYAFSFGGLPAAISGFPNMPAVLF